MILFVHLLFGAGIGSVVKNVPLAIALAFLTHYLLDILPHIEYGIENIVKRQWRKITPEVLRIILDLPFGILLIFLLSSNQPIIYICAFFALLPDGFTILNRLMSNKLLDLHDKLHTKIHFLKHKKISNFWRVLSQSIVVVISIILLRI